MKKHATQLGVCIASFPSAVTRLQLGNGINADFGEVIAVSAFYFVPFAAFFLENNYFVAFEVLQNSRRYEHTVEGGFSQTNCTICFGEHYAVKTDLCAFVVVKAVYKNLFAC